MTTTRSTMLVDGLVADAGATRIRRSERYRRALERSMRRRERIGYPEVVDGREIGG
jgi:hypothetical protein